MLTGEQAAERLEKLERADYVDELAAAVKKLHGPMRQAAYLLLDRNEDGESLPRWDAATWHAARNRAATTLHRASPKERGQLLRLLFGAVAPAVAQAWDYLPRLTYQNEYERRPFRAPNCPDLFRTRRFELLNRLVRTLGPYRHADDFTLPWVAAWTPYLDYGADNVLGVLFAAVLDANLPEAAEVYDILLASAQNEHEVGMMGRHVTRALLTCARPEAWEFVEKLLLAAQRQEGLRQVVLETVDEAHPDAFRRMLRWIIEHDLVRFSAVARAINVWFGFQWDSISTRAFNTILTQVVELMDDETARAQAIAGSDPEAVYHALWASAYEDAPAALAEARTVVSDKKPEKRFAALTLVGQLRLPEARPTLLAAMEDADLRIAVTAHLAAVRNGARDVDEDDDSLIPDDDHFERLEALVGRIPPSKKMSLKPLVWPWTAQSISRTALLNNLPVLRGKRSAGRVAPYLDEMDPRGRGQFAMQLVLDVKNWDADARRTALALAGDASSSVRECVLEALAQTRIGSDEATQLEAYLTRKAADLRRGVVRLLLSQSDDDALASAGRLLDGGQANQRLAGLELLRCLVEEGRQQDACRERARAYRDDRRQVTREEQTQLDAILTEKRETLTLENALGLMNPAERSPVVPPQPRKVQYVTPAALACLQALDALVEEHKDEPLTIKTYQGEQQQLLGNVQWGMPWPDWSKPREQELTKFPLRAVIEKWYAGRAKKERDTDGYELLRAELWVLLSGQHWYLDQWTGWEKRSPQIKDMLHALSGGNPFIKLRYQHTVAGFIAWLRYAHLEAGHYPFLLDGVEGLLARMPTDRWLVAGKESDAQDGEADLEADWRDAGMMDRWLDQIRDPRAPESVTRQQGERTWRLLHWFDQPASGVDRRRPPFACVLVAFAAGCATEADVLDDVLGPRTKQRNYGRAFDSLRTLTGRKPAPAIAGNPRLLALADRCRERLIAIELARGEAETPASRAATELGAVFGIDTLVKLLHGVGKSGFQRSDFWRQSGYSKPAVLSALVRVSYPKEADTPEAFAEAMRTAVNDGAVPEDRLLELAFQAPQWGPLVAHHFGWPGFLEGLWWFLAHMSAYVGDIGDLPVETEAAAEETDGDDGKKTVSPWEKLIRQRTPLTDAERRQGAIDMAWFRRVYAELGDKCWRRLGDAARWGSTSNRARKALHLGDVILGKANLKELIAGIRDRQLKESVRLLGIYPLPEGARREAALHERYRILVDYRRYAKSLSAMSKPVAMQAAQVGLENLARTAGFADPIRLEWAEEAKALADLVKGPVRVNVQGVTASLFLDEERQPELTYEKAGKPLKSLPAELKKHPKLAELVERRNDLKRQRARIKESLENAMCRGDTFTAAELRGLMEHPLLAPLLERLVLVGDGILGYPAKRGQALRNHAGKLEPIKKSETLRIAHPHDLLMSRQWHDWQHECFEAERVQPFKQVFRELYVATKQEKKDGAVSLRYAGQQVQPRQAIALWGARNWNTTDGISKTFYDLKLTATVWFKCGWGTPLEVEGWTLEGVEFRVQDAPKPLLLDQVPPRVFSEVMRDLDLVVSVAHRGGVDPEASASTVEMRANLLRETCTLLGIANYKIKDAHVLIDGRLGNYSVHLGSAVVHRRPGGAVCILPVHAQHRGRLFLPFADDDPRAAEVLSKVLLLARDMEIQDPAILEQLR